MTIALATTLGLLGFHVVLAPMACVHVLLNKRQPYAAALWIVIVSAVPFFGPIFYWFFGINRIARKARRRIKPGALKDVGPIRVPLELEPLRRVGDAVARYPLVNGNRIDLLVNGDEAYPAMLAAIESARHSLGIVSYIFDEDDVAERFATALRDAASRGVAVRLLVDGMGAWGMGPRLRRSLMSTGGRVAAFWPQGRFLKHPSLNLRNHRKILVADGRLGFTGGLNVSARHVTQDGEAFPQSSDVHFRLEGPVVEHLASTFVDDWELATGEVLRGPTWFPSLAPVGDVVARGIASGPDRTMGRLHSLLLGALRTARTRVDLMSPYFIPDQAILEAMRTASRSGVRVRLMLPRRADHRFMTWAARAYLWEVVEAGVEVYEVLPEFVHGKLAVVDGQWVMFGSSNLDARSFRLNFEFNVEAYSETLAQRVHEYLNHYRGKAERVTIRSLKAEPVGVRLRNAFVKLFSPYL
jgi:cardiolipin synthase